MCILIHSLVIWVQVICAKMNIVHVMMDTVVHRPLSIEIIQQVSLTVTLSDYFNFLLNSALFGRGILVQLGPRDTNAAAGGRWPA